MFQLEHFVHTIAKPLQCSSRNITHNVPVGTFERCMVPSSNMPALLHSATAAYALAAVFAWGPSDFLGGYATRRANAFLFAVVFNLGGLTLVATLAAATHAPF